MRNLNFCESKIVQFGVFTLTDIRLAKFHVDQNDPNASSHLCSCILKLVHLIRVQSKPVICNENFVFISHYEMAYVFVIFLGKAYYYSKERMVSELNPSFDVRTACKHLVKVLEYTNSLKDVFVFKHTSKKYKNYM